MKKSIQKNLVVLYFIISYAIAWGGILFTFRHEGFRPYQGEGVWSGSINRQFFLVWIFMLLAPALAGILFTAIADRKMGIRRLFSSILKWKAGLKWYAYALFIFPTLLLLIFFSFSFFAPQFYPSGMIVLGLAAGLIGGFFEEIGWTGFALPKLQLVFTPFKAAVILGVVHTFWHLLADRWRGINFYKELYVLHFLLWIAGLVALRLLITFIYNNTGSLLLAQLTHASFTGSQLMFSPSPLNPTESIQWYTVFVIILWAIVAVALITKKGKKILQKKAGSSQALSPKIASVGLFVIKP